MVLLYLSLLLGLLAVILFFLAYYRRKRVGIPSGRVIYIDTNQWGKVAKPMYDPRLQLTGKPDYLVQHGKQVIPIEVKSGRAPLAPYDSHIFQLGAYCLLVEHEYGTRPTHGIIHYSNKTFSIDFTPELEGTIEEVIRKMQATTSHSKVDRSHQESQRCHHCGYRSICDQVLRI